MPTPLPTTSGPPLHNVGVVAWLRAEPGLWVTVVWALVVVAVSTVPAVMHWDAILGNPLGETDNHLWMFWRASERILGRTEPLGNAPVGVDIPLMDPINVPAYLLGAWVSPAFGWRTMVSFNLVLAMTGAYALARQWTGPGGARVAMVAAGVAPFLGGMVDFGITESWPLGWFPLHTAFLVAHARTGRWQYAVLAGLSLGAIALSGWYHAFYGLLWEAMLVPVLLLRSRRAGLLWQGVIGAAMVVPSLLVFLPHRGNWEPRWRLPSPGPPGPRPDWGELPVFGVDVLTYVLPHPEVVSPSKATYLGLLVLGLSVVGLVRRTRLTLAIMGMSLPFLVLGLGYWPTLAGKAIGFPGPAKWIVDGFPALTGMSHWFRAVGPATMLLGVAAGLGADGLVRRRAWLSHVFALGLLLDAILGSPTAWPRASFRVEVPQSIEMLAGSGPIIQLPFDNGRAEFSDDPPRLYQRWQVGHGRPISENYEGVDALLAQSRLIAPVDAACLISSTLPPYYQVPPEMRGIGTPSAKRGLEMAQALSEQGFEWIILHRSRCPVTVTPIRALTKVLGPGIDLPGGDRAWPLRDGLAEETHARLEAISFTAPGDEPRPSGRSRGRAQDDKRPH